METSLTGKALVFGPREYGFESRVSNFMITNQHSYFLNQLKLGSSGRKYFFDARVTSATKPLAELLQRLNVIRRFAKLHSDKQVYRVFPAYSRHRRYSRSLTLYTKSSKTIILSYQSLRLLNQNSPYTYYVVETPKGVMTQKEAIAHRTGGNLLLIVH